MSLKERVEALLAHNNTNANAATEAAGLGKRFVQDILDEKKMSVTGKNARKLSQALNTTLEFLLYGDGPMIAAKDAETAEVIDLWSRMPAHQREAWLNIGRALKVNED